MLHSFDSSSFGQACPPYCSGLKTLLFLIRVPPLQVLLHELQLVHPLILQSTELILHIEIDVSDYQLITWTFFCIALMCLLNFWTDLSRV